MTTLPRHVDHRLSPEQLVPAGRDAERLALARAVNRHCQHRVLLQGNRAVAERLGAEVHDVNGKREKNFHLAVDTSCDPGRLRKALLSVMPEGYVNSVGIYFEDVRLPLLALYQRGGHFHNGKGHARPNMTPTLEAVAAGRLHPELVTSGIHAWEEIPEVLTSDRAGHKPVFVLGS